MGYLYSFLIVAAIAACLHIIFTRKPIPHGKIPAIFLSHLLFWAVGLAALLAAFGHLYPPQAKLIAAQMGWAADSPFQREVGFANLAISAIALVSLWIRGTFWIAAVVAATIFYWGAAIGHFVSPSPVTAPLVLDILIPALLIFFTIAFRVRAGQRMFLQGLKIEIET